ncbi:hypothetical protein F751_3860 [Auxenochlorella protothecoides]|uniref:Uncharacterized protein n=1 Tax=Auxenochlorella protothecoides TaxID=3075 RepID=A0A087SRJ6_AUXPR|nr:hypothetical protein F751_3860 [Auxenochlorella protothecoides]KFM28350.1 hypothetical protein F751_3860 [Auxenochlorella protothecoides]
MTPQERHQVLELSLAQQSATFEALYARHVRAAQLRAFMASLPPSVQARIAELPRAAQAGAVVRLLQQQQASQRAQQKAEHDTGAGMYMG